MNIRLDVLERSLLSDHTGLKTNHPKSRSITERHPRLYLGFIALLGLLGYTFVLAFPIGLIISASLIPNSIIAAQSYFDVTLILISIGIALTCAWVSFYLYKTKPSLPAGRPLNKEEAPALFETIEEIKSELSTSAIHHVRLIKDYHIELVRTPNNGFPLTYTNTLLIGLPLMQSLSAAQLTLAIRREMTHLSKSYKRLGSQIYFLNKTWCQYKLAHQNGWHPASIIMRAFFIWYAPLFKLFSEKATYMEEMYADKEVHKFDKNFVFIDMITTQKIVKKFLDDMFWPQLNNKAYKYKTPPYLPYSNLEQSIHSQLSNEDAQAWLDMEMDDEDIHSFSLKSRLKNIGIHTLRLPETSNNSAARYFLPETISIITKQMDRIWLKTHQFDWQQKYKIGCQEQNKLKELRIQANQGFLSDIKAWEYIQLIKKYIDEQDALPLYQQLLNINTHDARIAFDIGQSMLIQMNVEGIQALEQAIEKDKSYTLMACQLITKFYVRTGNSKLAQRYRRRALAYQVEAA